jgi:uncharacterized membrane protein
VAVAASAAVAREGAGDMKKFLKQLRDADIVTAIVEAEKKTSGEIRVFISRHQTDDPVAAAKAQFERLGMTNTKHRNGVLIFVAPRTSKFAIIGDTGVHQHTGDTFWSVLATEMGSYFRKSDFTGGIIHGIRKTGEVLAVNYPSRPDDTDELPNQVERD